MRTFLMGTLIVAVLVIATGALWWNSTRIEAWAEQKKTDWQTEQKRQQVKHADVFLRKGLEELDREIARLEHAQFEHRVAAEEARLRAGKQQGRLAEAEALAVEFAAATQKAAGQAFGFYRRTYTTTEAEAQLDRYAREVSGLRDGLGELGYNQIAHRNAAEHLAKAAVILQEAREKSRREGQRLIIDRDTADAKAVAEALSDPLGRGDTLPGGELRDTLKTLRDHILRREAEAGLRGTPGIEETLQRKRDLEQEEQVRQLKDELRQRANGTAR